MPPGQGQLLFSLRGSVCIRESGNTQGKVVHTHRQAHDQILAKGQLFRVANDARWSLHGLDEAPRVLAVATSVPREAQRHSDLLGQAARQQLLAPTQLFINEMVQVELLRARGRLPLRGWLPWAHVAAQPEYLVGLSGSFSVELIPPGGAAQESILSSGQLLRLPAGTRRKLRAGPNGEGVAVIVSARMHRQEGGSLDRSRVRGFTPFAR